MLNKKAIAAFAAGATLLSGLAFAAPAFVSAPAFAADSVRTKLKEANQKVEDTQKILGEKKGDLDKANEGLGKAKADFKTAYATAEKDVTDALDENGEAKKDYTVGADGKVTKTADSTEVTKATAALKGITDAKKAVASAQSAYDTANTNYVAALGEVQQLKGNESKYSTDVANARGDLTKAQGKVDEAFGKAVDAYVKMKAAKSELTKATRAVADFKDSTPASAKDYKKNLNALKAAELKAQNAFDAVNADYNDATEALEKAKSDYNDALGKYSTAYTTAKNFGNEMTSEDPKDLALDPADYTPAAIATAAAAKKGGNTGSGEEGKGGEGTTPTPDPKKVDYKAVVEFAVKYAKDAKSDAKTVKAVKAALAKVKAAKDKAAKKAALDELKKLVEPLMKKSPVDTGKALESIFGSDVLYTKYKGLAVDLIKLGVTNIGAYDGLLNQLEFGLSRFGWDNVIKNFPEHGDRNNCDFLAWLRRHLTKAVAHYGHVEAAVKDVQAELNEDMKDAQARHDWDAVKVIDQKIALANGLREVAHHNLTRAKALLDSANDHARDLSCDTAAKEVRAAMDKEPNSPFKKSGQKNNAQKPNGQNGQKPNGGAASHQLGKTGATVALVAVAASVLAGMGAALRKIRH